MELCGNACAGEAGEHRGNASLNEIKKLNPVADQGWRQCVKAWTRPAKMQDGTMVCVA
ncbi:hypothetical protein AA15669_0335 [Saccharibacter floricola DSM 15669]|uniref:LysM domain-containing protein n=1 Tax=Saccharibacter floricola DSM 15669 TaxID=1123227 RepID=A0ABQ0NX96_9PROT|nr:hypothetical protein AA15669_0335 [Saccharibacter floricola DSM 15669]